MKNQICQTAEGRQFQVSNLSDFFLLEDIAYKDQLDAIEDASLLEEIAYKDQQDALEDASLLEEIAYNEMLCLVC